VINLANKWYDGIYAAFYSLRSGDPDQRPYFKEGRVISHAFFALVPTFLGILAYLISLLLSNLVGWSIPFQWIFLLWLLFTIITLIFLIWAILEKSTVMKCPKCGSEWKVMQDMRTFSCWRCRCELKVQDGELVAAKGKKPAKEKNKKK
jgi:hypothetical protein